MMDDEAKSTLGQSMELQDSRFAGSSIEKPDQMLLLNRRFEFAIYLLLVLIAAALRFWDLGSRAMHHDESLHALYSWYLSSGGSYTHNPLMHGPFQFHGTALIYALFGDSDFTTRLLPAMFGTVLVALPFFVRSRLGQIGSLFASTMLAVSPSFVYFSRFARNDVYMVVWTLGLVIVIWRFMETRQSRYLYLTAGLMGVAFATKETVYIITLIFGSYLFMLAAKEFPAWCRRCFRTDQASPATQIFVLMVVLSLPLGAAGISLFENLLNVTLANSDHTQGPVGLPLGRGAAVIAGVTILVAFHISFLVGHYWLRKAFWISFGIFWGVWILLYTTIFTNLAGIGTGMWQSLGYWIVQHEVARGGQPWYYYLILTPVYELLPLVFGIVGGIYYLIKGNRFTRFLAYWALWTLFFYSFAGEKMPWLLVNVTLPLILLSAKFLGDLSSAIPWNRMNADLRRVVTAVTLTLSFAAFGGVLLHHFHGLSGLLLMTLLTVCVLTGIGFMFLSLGRSALVQVTVLTVAFALLLFSFRTSWILNFEHSDVPVEMLVYTQTSPDVPRIAKEFRSLAEQEGTLSIVVDSADGFSWPWSWYLRDYQGVSYPCFDSDVTCTGITSIPGAQVLLLALRNEDLVRDELDGFVRGERYQHRWWFPEYSSMNYRGITPSKFLEGVTRRTTWETMMRYFLYRDIIGELGSSDAVVYYSKELSNLPKP